MCNRPIESRVGLHFLNVKVWESESAAHSPCAAVMSYVSARTKESNIRMGELVLYLIGFKAPTMRSFKDRECET